MENDPGEFSVANEEIRTAAQKFVWNAIVIKEAKQSRNGFVPLDEEEIRRSADAERGVLGHGDSGLILDAKFSDGRAEFGVLKTHGAMDAPFQARP